MADDGGETIVREVIGYNKFRFENEEYVVIQNEKPKPDKENIPTRPSAVEGKTDFYLLAKKINDGTQREFKISYKKPSFSFVENKVKKHRIPFIYGNDWKKILQVQAESIQDLFNSECLVNFNKKTIKLGWRYEIEQLDAPGIGNRNLSVNITQNISPQVLWGSECAKGMKNAFVNGKIVNDSGIPNYILIKDTSNIKTINDVFDDLQEIQQYAKNHQQMRASYIAQNNRWIQSTHRWKTEGKSRGFPVWINWDVKNDFLRGRPIFNEPYEKNSGEIINTLQDCFKELNIPYQDGLNFEMLKNKFSKDTVIC